MRADNTSVVTLMLDPPGPPRATVLRSRSSAARAAVAAPPAPAPPPHSPPPEPDTRPVPQNGLTIMTRYSDAERAPPPAPDAPLPPCATLDTRLPAPAPTPAPPTPPADDEPRDEPDPDLDDAILNYGNPAESYFMARLLNRTRVVNTLSAVHDEIAGDVAPRAPSEPRERQPTPATVVPDADTDGDASTARPPLPPRTSIVEPTSPAAEQVRPAADDGGIQINEVSSSSPTEGPPRPRGRRPRTDLRRDPAPAAPDRVLRSHDAETPQRPQTRQSATRARPAVPSPAPPVDRVVILTRRATPGATPVPPPPPPRTDRVVVAAESRPAVRRVTPAPTDSAPADEDAKRGGTRATRSQAAVAVTPLAQKITRSIGLYARELRGAAAAAAAAAGARAGNSARAPGPARRAPAARRPPADRSKENLGAARGRARARAAPAASPSPPAPRPRTRRADSARDHEVHSTTGEPPAHAPEPAACAGAPTPGAERPRALRSRNDAGEPPRRDAQACKRARCEEGGGGASKAARLAPERCARALGKRATGPWAPALALRNRLRRRLAK